MLRQTFLILEKMIRISKFRIDSSSWYNSSIHDQLLSPYLILDIPGNVDCPRVGGVVQLITRLPRKDSGIILVRQSCQRIDVIEQEADVVLEVIDNICVGVEDVLEMWINITNTIVLRPR